MTRTAPYASLWRWADQQATVSAFDASPLPGWERAREFPDVRHLPVGEDRQCYSYATYLAETGMGYVEGFILPRGGGAPVAHAWNMDAQGPLDTVMDPRHYGLYVGVEIPHDEFLRVWQDGGARLQFFYNGYSGDSNRGLPFLRARHLLPRIGQPGTREPFWMHFEGSPFEQRRLAREFRQHILRAAGEAPAKRSVSAARARNPYKGRQ